MKTPGRGQIPLHGFIVYRCVAVNCHLIITAFASLVHCIRLSARIGSCPMPNIHSWEDGSRPRHWQWTSAQDTGDAGHICVDIYSHRSWIHSVWHLSGCTGCCRRQNEILFIDRLNGLLVMKKRSVLLKVHRTEISPPLVSMMHQGSVRTSSCSPLSGLEILPSRRSPRGSLLHHSNQNLRTHR